MARTIAVLLPAGAEAKTTSFPAPGRTSDASGARPYLGFAVGEATAWTLVVPQGFSGPITALITYAMASATANAVEWRVEVEAISDGDALDTDASERFDSVNDSGDVTVPGTAGHIDQVSLAATNGDSAAAGDMLRIRLTRTTPAGTSASGDANVYVVELRDAA